MTPERVQAWLDAYVEAWRSYDSDAIAALFSEAGGAVFFAPSCLGDRIGHKVRTVATFPADPAPLMPQLKFEP